MDLFPTYPEDGPTIIQAIKKQPVALNDLLRVADVPDPYVGSNNWVLSGAKSASGKPMLANDPHLSLSLPAIWYETNLVGPGLNVSGVNIPGIPGILLGHNEHIAWGMTNMGPDAMDLYIEKRNPNNKNEFEYMGEWEPATIYKEHIEVKGADPIEYEILTTRHGPIISEFAKDDKPDTALALRWTALEPSTEIEAVRRFGLARDWNEFAKALNFFQAPAQNFVFASDDGTIAYKGNGLIPIRKKGNGSLPVPGWTDEYEWTGYIPWKELPTVVNPPEGFIATANNKIIDDSYPYHITDSWGDAYRATRIRQALESKAVLSEEDMQKLQFDRHNMQAEQFLAGLLETFKGDAALRGIDKDAIELLKKWNKEDDPDLGAPLIFNEWIQHFDEVFKPEISDDLMRFFEDKDTAMNEMLRKALSGEKEPWIDAKGGIKQVALRAFQAAVDKISGMQGKDASKWQVSQSPVLQRC
jgi:penicillin amidase